MALNQTSTRGGIALQGSHDFGSPGTRLLPPTLRLTTRAPARRYLLPTYSTATRLEYLLQSTTVLPAAGRSAAAAVLWEGAHDDRLSRRGSLIKHHKTLCRTAVDEDGICMEL